MFSKFSLLSAVALGAWEPTDVGFDLGNAVGSPPIDPLSETDEIDGEEVEIYCDYAHENPITNVYDLETLYADQSSYSAGTEEYPCACSDVQEESGDAAFWETYLDGEYLITGFTLTEDKINAGYESLDEFEAWVGLGSSDEDLMKCGVAESSTSAGTRVAVECEGAGFIADRVRFVSSSNYLSICRVEVTGYPLPEPFIEELEAQLVVDRLYHKEDSEYYDILQTKYDTLSDYYNTVQERFVELSNLYNEVSLWKSEVDGEATLLQAVIDKYEARTVGENCVFGLAGFAWWCKEASPIAY